MCPSSNKTKQKTSVQTPFLTSWPGRYNQYLRFVLLRHTDGFEGPHYDLMLELQHGWKQSERILRGLQCRRKPVRGAKSLEWDTHGIHRRRNLHLKGDLGKGRGKVERIDDGVYRVAKHKGRLYIFMDGWRMQGQYVMLRAGHGKHLWLR